MSTPIKTTNASFQIQQSYKQRVVKIGNSLVNKIKDLIKTYLIKENIPTPTTISLAKFGSLHHESDKSPSALDKLQEKRAMSIEVLKLLTPEAQNKFVKDFIELHEEIYKTSDKEFRFEKIFKQLDSMEKTILEEFQGVYQTLLGPKSEGRAKARDCINARVQLEAIRIKFKELAA